MLDNWSKTPKHILRKGCIDDAIKKFKPGYFLEMGAGNGDLTALLLKEGFYGKCYDIGDQTRAILKDRFSDHNNKIEVLETLNQLQENSFEYLFAFEVLEHIKDDFETLKTWTLRLRQGGILLISVPAHISLFSFEDELVGHHRRYEKADIYNMVEDCGYYDIQIYCYGFPLGNLTRRISFIINRLKKSPEEKLTMEQKSIESGIRRAQYVNKLSFLFNEQMLIPFVKFQRVFYERDWGDGYVLCAVKR